MDNASINRAKLTQELIKGCGTTPTYASPYSHTGNAIAERFMRTIEEALSHFVSKSSNNWHLFLPGAVFGINTCVHSGSQYSSFYLVHGREPRFPADLAFPHLPLLEPNYLTNLQNARKEAQYHLIRRQDQSSVLYNKSRRDLLYPVGSQVMVSFPNLKEAAAAKKLSPLYSGPFKILESLPKLNYRLNSRLTKCKGRHNSCEKNEILPRTS